MADENAAKRTGKIQFHYIKSSAYREVVCNGVIGGTTPRGDLWIGVYAERGAIPQTVEYEVDVNEGDNEISFNESAATPSHVESRSGVVRFIEVSAYMNFETAEKIHKWLGVQIDSKNESKK